MCEEEEEERREAWSTFPRFLAHSLFPSVVFRTEENKTGESGHLVTLILNCHSPYLILFWF